MVCNTDFVMRGYMSSLSSLNVTSGLSSSFVGTGLREYFAGRSIELLCNSPIPVTLSDSVRITPEFGLLVPEVRSRA